MEAFAKGYERSGEAGAQDDDQTSQLARWMVLASTDLQNGRERTGCLGQGSGKRELTGKRGD